LLWQTREAVGTPENDPRLICFINGKSSSARSGLLVHMTAPTIHAGWWGQITLEIANLGPFDLCLAEGDAISQIVVATISSPPTKRKKEGIAIGQREVGGNAS
jgi:dCTP deaminase